MLIGIFSDTHDNLKQIDRAVQLFHKRRVDAVLHAGDIVAPFAAKTIAKIRAPLHVVYGNNDGEKVGLKLVLPQIRNEPLQVDLGGKNIVMAHDFDHIPKKLARRADIIVSGHTHKPLIKTNENQMIINPGECGGWLKGRSTVAILETDRMVAEIVDLPV